MTLRDDVQQLMRLRLAQSPLGDRALMALGERTTGDVDEVLMFLIAYCNGLEAGILRIAMEIDADRTQQIEAG